MCKSFHYLLYKDSFGNMTVVFGSKLADFILYLNKFVESFGISVMLMEWNACPPFQCDWDHLFMLNAKSTDNSKLQQTDWFGDVDRDTNAGSFYLSWGSAGSGSDHLHSSKRSKSVSINSSSIGESKTSKLAFQGIQEDSSGKDDASKNEPNGSSPALEPSSSGEPLLSLKLGKRLYFEDFCPENDLKSTFSVIPISTSTTAKKCRSNVRSNQPPCCQVEGCNLDLSSAKDYHRKHRVCEGHSKSPKVVVCGLERRFCQQCSRFHDLSEFDEKKRSCRRRLSDHNARRRKPHTETVRFRSSLSSTAYAAENTPQAYSGSTTSLMWQDACTNFQSKELLMKSAKGAGTSGQLDFSRTEPTDITAFSECARGILPVEGTANKTTTNPGSGESMAASGINAPQTFHRALSLLSTNSWDQCETKPKPVGQAFSRQTANSEITLPGTHPLPRGLPLYSSEHWLNEQHHFDSSISILNSECGSNRFQDFQLLKAPYNCYRSD